MCLYIHIYIHNVFIYNLEFFLAKFYRHSSLVCFILPAPSTIPRILQVLNKYALNK